MKIQTFNFAGNRVCVYKSPLDISLWTVSFNDSHLWALFSPVTMERELWGFMNMGIGARKVYRQLELKRGATIDRDKFNTLIESIRSAVRLLS